MTTTRRRITPLLFAWALLASGAGSAACAAVFGFERLSEEVATPDASPEGEPPFEAGPACGELGIPDRPRAVDAGAGSDGAVPSSIHMAMKLLDLGIDKAAPAVGFNLDRACTPTVETSSCTTSVDNDIFAKAGRDTNDKGLDNATFGLLAYLAILGDAFSPVAMNNRLQRGEFSLVLRLTSWNGSPDDDDVTIEIFPAIGLSKETDGGSEAGTKPSFTADDEWIRDRRFNAEPDTSRIKSTSAWVTGGRLVASFASVTLVVTVPGDPKRLDVSFQEAFLSGMLVQEGLSWKLDQNVLGGRWRTADILEQVRMIYVRDSPPLKNVVLCDPNLPFNVYNAVKKEVCEGRDLRNVSREDNKALPCEALSAGLRFETYPLARAGAFGDLPAIGVRCQIEGGVPAGDDCAPAFP